MDVRNLEGARHAPLQKQNLGNWNDTQYTSIYSRSLIAKDEDGRIGSG
jgi:hypothetical protein